MKLRFFTTQYRPSFVETAAIALGYLGLLIVAIGQWLGVL